jgi:hypothetical protein
VNLGGTFYFLITALDGYSRYILLSPKQWEARTLARLRQKGMHSTRLPGEP